MVYKISELISYDNDVFRTYAFWVAVLVVKMLGMSLLTAIQRFKNKVKFSILRNLIEIKKIRGYVVSLLNP